MDGYSLPWISSESSDILAETTDIDFQSESLSYIVKRLVHVSVDVVNDSRLAYSVYVLLDSANSD